MNNKVVTTIIGAAALTGVSYAGEVAAEAPAPTAEFHTCDALKSLGKVYKNSENPWIQEVKIFGRAQFQYGYVDGTNGSEGFAEWRRLRVGGQVKFANYFDVLVRANVEDGGVNDHDIDFGGYDEAKLGFRLDKAFDLGSFDKVYLTYGRDKIEIGEDVHTSSKKIKTVERTALTGAIRPDNSTGAALTVENGGWTGAFGVFNAEGDGRGDGDNRRDLVSDFGDEQFFYFTSGHEISTGELIFDFIFNPNADEDVNDYSNDWAFSAAYRTELWNWDWAFNGVIAENGTDDDLRDGLFGGIVIQPSKFIWEDKLEFVGRYYFQLSEAEEGISVNSRLSGQSDDDGDTLIGDRRGDQHHSIYAGLNYYLCGERAKIMTGVEYEALDTANGGENATTLWTAFRMYF